MNSRCHILVLDQSGLPKEWVTQREAIIYQATEKVSWQMGDNEVEVIFRGGTNRVSGNVSKLMTAPIIALKKDSIGARRMAKVPTLSNKALFRRDNFRCAYCGQYYKEAMLTRDHIMPTSKGGPNIWNNVVTACKNCNNYKDDYLLSEIDLLLLFPPYTPNHAEALILSNGNILQCQVDYLLSFVSSKSRVTDYLKKFKHLEIESGNDKTI